LCPLALQFPAEVSAVLPLGRDAETGIQGVGRREAAQSGAEQNRNPGGSTSINIITTRVGRPSISTENYGKCKREEYTYCIYVCIRGCAAWVDQFFGNPNHCRAIN